MPAVAGDVVIVVNTGSAPAASTDTLPAVSVATNSKPVAEIGSDWTPLNWSSSRLPVGGALTVVSSVVPFGVALVAVSGSRMIRSPPCASSIVA